MPIWSEVLSEVNATSPPDFDGVRRKYLAEMYSYTKRNTICYISGWLQKDNTSRVVSIGDEDIQSFMEVTHGLHGDNLDLILHSPGGSPESAEAIVSYLRSRFNHIRIIVPQLAMSAATMIACAADEIVLGKHSFLGPIDPLLICDGRAEPAQAILDQFDFARHECLDNPDQLGPYMPILGAYGPSLLMQCVSAIDMSRELVTGWLKTYMFKNIEPPELRDEKATAITEWLGDHQHFKSHNRHISRDEVNSRGLTTIRLEEDEKLQDLSLSTFHAATITLGGTSSIKIVENHMGNAFIKQVYIPQPVQVGE